MAWTISKCNAAKLRCPANGLEPRQLAGMCRSGLDRSETYDGISCGSREWRMGEEARRRALEWTGLVAGRPHYPVIHLTMDHTRHYFPPPTPSPFPYPLHSPIQLLFHHLPKWQSRCSLDATGGMRLLFGAPTVLFKPEMHSAGQCFREG